MNITLQKSTIVNQKSVIQITGSKSESNRLLVLQALFPQLSINNLSNSDDTKLMQKALSQLSCSTSRSSSTMTVIDIHHAGTAMRFLTAYIASIERLDVSLTGSSRMKERPIQILVDALRQLGADISYRENEGFPPLKIKGKVLTASKVALNANVSSQYISALLLIAPKLKNGLELTLEGEITSLPYITMTLSLLHSIGIETEFKDNTITLQPHSHDLELKTTELNVESDWSSASYWYSCIALSVVGTEITLSSYKKDSLQGDAVLVEIYTHFGVETRFHNDQITLRKSSIVDQQTVIHLDLKKAPDIAQTIAVTAFGLGLECHLTGLHTLKIKETDRLVALQNELSKFKAKVEVTNDSFHLKAHTMFQNSGPLGSLGEFVATYNDHRMAMAFAPLALKTNLTIKDAEVVSKSYPTFWDDLKKVGFQLTTG